MPIMDVKLTVTEDVDNPVAGDLYLDAGDVSWIDGAEAVAQHIRCRLRMFHGEWFLNEDEGTPWFDSILEKGITDGRIASILRRVIAGTPGVVSVSNVSLTRDSSARQLDVEFECVTDEGVTITSDDYGPFVVPI
jgi:hypothetical protein